MTIVYLHLIRKMDLMYVLVINLFGLLIPCQCIEFLDIILNDTNIEQQWATKDLDAEEFVRNKIRFLKLLPLNKDWKNKIVENGIQTESKNIDSVPIVLILATAGSSEDVRDTQSETSIDTNPMISRNDNVQNVKEEIVSSSTETSVSLNETNQEKEDKDAINEIEEMDYTVREELPTTTTETPLNDNEDENIHEIDKEDLAAIEDIKNDIEHALEECKNDKNCKFTPEEDTSEVAEDLFVSQEKYSLEDPRKHKVTDGKSLDKTYKLSIVINKYIVVK